MHWSQWSKARERTAQSRTAGREETRRKFLIGAVVLARVEKGLLERSLLPEWLIAAIERPEDLALFGFDDPKRGMLQRSGPKSDLTV